MSTHRVIVFRTWHREDGSRVRSNILTGYPKAGTPVWHADCITCQKALGVYSTEKEARQVTCNTTTSHAQKPSPVRLPVDVATARRMWLAGHTGKEIAEQFGCTPEYACRLGSGLMPAAHRLTNEERESVARLHAEAVKIRRREAA